MEEEKEKRGKGRKEKEKREKGRKEKEKREVLRLEKFHTLEISSSSIQNLSLVQESPSCKATSTAEHEILAVRLVWILVEVPHLGHLVSSSGLEFRDFIKSRYALSTLSS